jgi:ubiquinol-cytochrome c reductase cytochrome c subunit
MRRLAVALAALALAPAAAAATGKQLYFENCVWCHGDKLQGVPLTRQQEGPGGEAQAGPRLRGVGEVAADFYLSTGYMPLGDPAGEPHRKRPLFNAREQAALRAYVASLGPGPKVPSGRRSAGSISRGLVSFSENCAGCHQIVGEGGVVTGAKVPPLDQATPRQIREAVRLGPYVMPQFSAKSISDAELEDIVAYVQYTQEPHDEGGWGINHLGPFPEGLVTWFIAIVVLVMTCVVIGSRLKKA